MIPLDYTACAFHLGFALEGDRMIQTVKKNLEVPRILRHLIALLAGASPFILAFIILVFGTKNSAIPHDTGWIRDLIQHQDDIIQTLIVSSLMVALFSTLLRSKVVILVAGFQPVLIQTIFILTDVNRHIALNLPLAAITVLPLVIVFMSLRREIDQLDAEERLRRAIDSEKRNTST